MQNNIVIHGYYGAGNFGDDIILHSIISSIYSKIPKANIVVLSRDMSPIPSCKYKYKTVSRYDFNAINQEIKKADLFICGGGGIFQDYSGFDIRNHFGDKRKGIDYYAVPIELAYLHEVPVMLYAVGVGPFFNRKSTLNVKTLLNWADVVTVRDEESKKIVEEINPHVKAILTSDPAVNYLSKNQPKNKASRRYFGVCLREWFFKKYQRGALIKSMARAIDYTINKYNINVVIFSFCKNHNDLKLLQELKNNIKNKDHVFVENKVTMKEAIITIQNMDFVIGMRLHSLLMAASIGKPIIALSYDRKIENFMNQIGQNNLTIPIDDLNINEIKNKVDNLIKNSAKISKIITDKMDVLRLREKQNIDIAMDLIRKRS
ncbi:polysaccharide pyruvyl transferase CsaB [Clostridiaceae bacterium M8S5]|nr:polysaccharide pyruvyl transferase CsaB [Clostridiaceae bacterium M8S5]